MELLPSEKKHVEFINKYGRERATRLLDALCRRFDRRYEKACDNAFAPINREWVYQTPFEVEMKHHIKMGLTLTDTENTPMAAHQRILERISKRNAQRASKLSIN